MKSRCFLLAGGLFFLAVAGWAQEPVQAGFGTIKINGLAQAWYYHDETAGMADTFRLRRMEIRLSGNIRPEIAWFTMIDPAQIREDLARKSPLQDFGVSFLYVPKTAVNIGQLKVPFGMEGLEPSAKLDTIERSAMSAVFKWTDIRDQGVWLSGDYEVAGVALQPTLGVFNGEGQNTADVNDRKDVAGRLVAKPVQGLHLGAAFYQGQKGAVKVLNERWGLEAKYGRDRFSVKTEYAQGHSGGLSRQTAYGAAAYRFLKDIEGVVKYDWWDPDRSAGQDIQNEITGGLTYYLESYNAKVAVNYVKHLEEGPGVSNDLLRTLVQVMF